MNPPRQATQAATIAVAGLVLGVWLAFGVEATEILRYLGYQLAFIGLPGWLILRALCPGEGALAQLALGWALGYALEIGAFAGAAALGLGDAFLIYPALVGGGALAVSRRRAGAPSRLAGPTPARPRWWAWSLAAISAVLLAHVVLAYYSQTPLPGGVAAVDYDKDSVYWLSLAGEAKHQWPLEDPNLSGERLPYHWFAFVHLAAVSDVTSVGLPTLLFRLDLVPMLLLLVLLLALAGERMGGRPWLGPLAATLALLVGELDLHPQQVFAFRNVFLARLITDPGILLGAVFFLPCVLLLWELIGSPGGRGRRGRWLLLALFLAGASGAKAVILPVLAGALVLVAAWRWWTARRLERPVLIGLAAVLVAFAASFAVLYRGAEDQLVIEPLALFDRGAVETFWSLWQQYVPILGDLEILHWPLALVVGTAGLMGPLLVATAIAVAGRPVTLAEAWPLALLVAGLGATYLLLQDGNSQEFFMLYGALAGAPLAARGVERLLTGGARLGPAQAWIAAAWVLCLVGVALIPAYLLDLSAGSLFAVQYSLLVAGVLAAVGLGRARRMARGGRAVLAFAFAAILLAGALDAPLDFAPPLVERRAGGEPAYSRENRNLTPGLYEGLAWVRDRTGADSVLAVNNEFRDRAGRDARYFYYSGLGERPVFLEGWSYSNASGVVPARRRLNQAAFTRADPGALCTLKRSHGVTHLLVDRVHGPSASALGERARIAFSNADVVIYSMPACGPA